MNLNKLLLKPTTEFIYIIIQQKHEYGPKRKKWLLKYLSHPFLLPTIQHIICPHCIKNL